jgi:hypothetical protein
MLFSKAELQPTPIVENQKIQKTLPFKFESKLLPFQLGKCKNLHNRESPKVFLKLFSYHHTYCVYKRIFLKINSIRNTSG